jgi:hypothetical protein
MVSKTKSSIYMAWQDVICTCKARSSNMARTAASWREDEKE